MLTLINYVNVLNYFFKGRKKALKKEKKKKTFYLGN